MIWNLFVSFISSISTSPVGRNIQGYYLLNIVRLVANTQILKRTSQIVLQFLCVHFVVDN